MSTPDVPAFDCLLSARHAAALLDVSVRRFYEIVHAGRIPIAGSVGDGGDARFWKSDVLKYATTGTPRILRATGVMPVRKSTYGNHADKSIQKLIQK